MRTRIIFIFLVFGAIFCAPVSGQTIRTECFVRGAKVVAEHYDPVARRGVVVLSHPEGGEAEGVGLAPAERFPIQAQAKLMALEAARAVAFAKLGERLCGVSISK